MFVDYKNMKTISNYSKYVKISTCVFSAASGVVSQIAYSAC